MITIVKGLGYLSKSLGFFSGGLSPSSGSPPTISFSRLFMIPAPGPRGNLEGEPEDGAAKISLAFVNRKIFEGQKKKYKILQDIVQEKNLVLVAPFEYSLLLLDNESGKVVEEAELSF